MTDVSGLTHGAAVVTGAASGIGRAVAVHAVQLGFRVALVDLASEPLEAVAASLRAAGGEVLAVTADVGDPTAMHDLADVVSDTWGAVSLLVNNAGIEATGRLWEIPHQQWTRTLDVNVTGLYNGIRSFLPRMLSEGRPAHIVSLASIGAITTGPFQAPYIASKHAILALTECLAQELQAEMVTHVGVSAVLPGPVRTQIFASASSADVDGPGATQRRAMEGYLADDGMDPVDVASTIFAGIQSDQLRIHTHPELSRPLITRRMGDLLDGTTPHD